MKRARLLILLVAILGGALFFTARNRPQIEISQKPVPDAKVKAALSNTQLAALEKSEKVILYSLYPLQMESLPTAQKVIASVSPTLPPITKLMHGYAVLGEVELDGTRRNAVLKEFYDGISEASAMAMCFNPRHGIHVERAGKSFDFVICFECEQFVAFPDAGRRSIPIAKDSQAVFNALLKDANVPLSPM